MSTHIIILCQGSQSRLPNLPIAKQMLPLAACGEAPILIRTIVQLSRLAQQYPGTRVEIVAWQPLIEALHMSALYREAIRWPAMRVDFRTLPDPGNSSLKGAAHTLARRLSSVPGALPYAQTVILLGDVVYSWDALRAAMNGPENFLGTADLSPSGGELFAVRWIHSHEPSLQEMLSAALHAHPKFTEYQPGQMRRWLVGGRDWSLVAPKGASALKWYRCIDDYTDDVDLPADVANLDALSALAAADDDANGVTW